MKFADTLGRDPKPVNEGFEMGDIVDKLAGLLQKSWSLSSQEIYKESSDYKKSVTKMMKAIETALTEARKLSKMF